MQSRLRRLRPDRADSVERPARIRGWHSIWLLACVLLLARSSALAEASPPREAAQQQISEWIGGNLEAVLATYRQLHANPELSLEERETAALVAIQLEEAGYTVTRGVGGTGVVGVLRNGPGSTLLLRGDMDALPVTEQTELPYASRITAKREDGSEVGVMHACGHDVHISNLLGSAAFLAASRELWSGTLVIVAQPAEELGQGALDMIRAGLFDRFPKPDYTLALHVDPEIAAGQVGYVSGWAAANVDSVDIRLFGRGGHGARPHQANDPIVTAAHLIVALQTLVSRRIDPQAPGVVTVGAIHAGQKRNVIPDEALLQLTVRSYSDEVRQQLLDGIRQLARDVCRTHQCPAPPEVTLEDEYTPAVYNDPELAARAARVFAGALGAENVVLMQPTMGGEDFGRYARTLDVPGLLFRLGAIAPERLRASRAPGGAPLPGLHSSGFAPDARDALRAGIRATTSLAIDLLTPSAERVP